MRRLFIFILILCVFAQPCYAGLKAKREVKEGNLLYNEGKFEEALKRYQEALMDSPDSEVVNFNLGAALYKTEDYKAAIGNFEKSLLSPEPSLEQKASYNLGNAKYKYGIGKEETALEEAIGLLGQSLRHYERAIELDDKDGDARHNYEFVKRELERLKKKLQQQPQPQEQQEKQKEEGEQEKEKPKEEEEGKEGPRPEEQEQQKEPEGEKGEEKEREPEPGESQVQQPIGEMTEEEAEMLLDNYRHEEEPKGMYKEKLPVRGLPEVDKDW